MRSTRIKLLIFLAVFTSFGSSLSAIGTFLAIGRIFRDANMVALALALKTLSSVVLTKFTRKFALKSGIYASLIISQLSGLPILLIMIYGFQVSSLAFIMSAVFLSGISGNLLNLVFAPLIKELAVLEDDFKRWQGLQQTLIGFGSLTAGLVSPWILDGIGVNGLYAIDGITFLIAAFVLWLERSWYRDNFKTKAIISSPPTGGSSKLKDVAELKALFYIIPSFFFTGLVPIVASSGMQESFLQAPSIVERLWMTESIANMITGWAYFKFNFLRTGKWILSIPLFCSVPLIGLFFSRSSIVFYAAFLAYSLLSFYGFSRYRDDLFASSSDLDSRINHSAFHLLTINLLRTISAPTVSLMMMTELSKFQLIPIRAIIVFQCLMGAIGWILLKRVSAKEPLQPASTI